nr:AMP-binding protein [Parafrankia elaeagni]
MPPDETPPDPVPSDLVPSDLVPSDLVPSGEPVLPVLPGELTVPALLALRRRLDGGVQAFVSDDDEITYAGLDDASQALAGRLVAAGVTKGSRVGLVMPNGIGWATAAAAVMRVGAVLVPLSTLLRPPELLAQLRVAAVTHLVVVPRLRGRDHLDELASVAPALTEQVRRGRPHPDVPSLRWIWSSDELPTGAAPAPVVEALGRAVRPADDLVVLFTSGSRGAPKGVLHTHGGGLRAVASSLDSRRIGRGERLYIPMPFFWTGGFGGGLLSVLVAGATLLTEAVPEPARTLRFLERERVTLFRGWPDQAARLAAHPAFAATDLSALRPASLGAVLPPATRPAPGARANLFGMTETFGPYCGSPLDTDLPADKHGSCGRPFTGVEARIADPETGAALPPRAPRVRSGCAGRTSCAASPAGTVRTSSTPTGSTPPPTAACSTPTATSGTEAASTTWSRSAARRSTRWRSRRSCARCPASPTPTSPTSPLLLPTAAPKPKPDRVPGARGRSRRSSSPARSTTWTTWTTWTSWTN